MVSSDLLTRAIGNSDWVATLERAAAAFPKFRDRLPHIPYAYTRTRLLETPHYELVAMQWSAGSLSPVHDHGESRCWVLMLEGTLDVENFERDDDGSEESHVRMHPTGKLSIGAGDLDHRLNDRELHRVANTGDASAYSLQLYAAPISTYNVFDEHTHSCRIVTATCDLHIDFATL